MTVSLVDDDREGLLHCLEARLASLFLKPDRHMRNCPEKTHCSCEVKIFFLVWLANLSAVLIGFLGWYVTRSASVLSDAYHGLSDSADNFGALIIALVAITAVSRKTVANLRLLFAFFGFLLLWVGLIHIFFEAMERFHHPRSISAAVIVFSIPSLVFNFCSHALLEHMSDDLKTVTSSLQDAHVRSDLILSLLAVISGAAIASTNALADTLSIPLETTGWIDMCLALIACAFLVRIAVSGFGMIRRCLK